MNAAKPRGRLVAVEIDARSIAGGPGYIDQERAAAIRDLIAENLFAPEGRTFRAMADLANRLREQQHPALICIPHDAVFLAGSETAIRVPMAVPEWVSPLVYAVAGQLFAYWLSVSKGLDPDTPRSIERMTKTV